MDFFARQDSARKHTSFLLVYFGLAILGTSALVYFVALIGLELLGIDAGAGRRDARDLGRAQEHQGQGGRDHVVIPCARASRSSSPWPC